MNGKKVELLANVAIIVLALILSAVLVKKFAFDSSPKTPAEIKVGENITLPNVNVNLKEHTILIALQPNCPYCTASADFYREIKKAAGENPNFQTTVLFSSEAENEKEYLNKIGLQSLSTEKTSFDELKIIATPTVLVVGKNGMVESVWRGKLSPDREKEFIAQLK